MTPNQLIAELKDLPDNLKNANIINSDGREINSIRRACSCGPSRNKPPTDVKDEKLILESNPIMLPEGKYVVDHLGWKPAYGKY